MRNKNGEDLLVSYIKIWDNYLIFSRLIDKMFDYLNRYYLKN